MFALVKIGSKQYKVAEGDSLSVGRIKGNIGEELIFDKVLMVSDGKGARVGHPFLEGAKVSAKVMGHRNEKKVITIKYRKRKDSATKTGGRPKSTALSIIKIQA